LVLCVPYLVALAALLLLSFRSRPRRLRETLATMGRAPSTPLKGLGG
jgi:simple sugar transport system permease protein